MEIQGKIIQVLQLQQGVGQASGKEWKKQEYVLETITERFPKKIAFSLWGDAIDRFMIREGDELTLSIDIESREWNGRWYTDVRAYNVIRGMIPATPYDNNNMTTPTSPVGANWPTQNNTEESTNDELEGSDLPF